MNLGTIWSSEKKKKVPQYDSIFVTFFAICSNLTFFILCSTSLYHTVLVRLIFYDLSFPPPLHAGLQLVLSWLAGGLSQEEVKDMGDVMITSLWSLTGGNKLRGNVVATVRTLLLL